MSVQYINVIRKLGRYVDQSLVGSFKMYNNRDHKNPKRIYIYIYMKSIINYKISEHP